MNHRETRPHEATSPIRERSRSPSPAIGVGNVIPYICPLCDLDLSTQLALWGHMDAHNYREWRGMTPPPAARIEEDFTDYEGEVDDAEREEVEVDDVESHVVGPINEASTGEPEEGEEPMFVDEEKHLIPDLNESPPPEE